MALARNLNFDTAFEEPTGHFVAVRSSGANSKVQELDIVKPSRHGDSFVDHVPVIASASEVGEMHAVRVPESVDNRASVWSEINQTWEGRVVENSPENREFVAIISDRTCRSNPDEEVVIGYESVIESDLGLISEGAVFFWNVGKYRKFSEKNGKIGPAVNKYELRFRRLPPISPETIEEIMHLSKGLSKIIHGY